VAQSFLPPDPNSPADPARRPPAAGAPRPAASATVGSDRPKLGLGLSVAGLAVVVLSSGLGSPASLPLSAAGWVLGRRSKRQRADAPPGVDHANLAVVIGAIGVALGLIALTGWIVLIAIGGWDETSTPARDKSGLTFSLARGAGALAHLAG
jgi:hypothetical protein